MTRRSPKGIHFGDRRILAESTVAEPFDSPLGISYPVGSVIRMSAFITLHEKEASFTLPSMAELIFQQAEKELTKASKIQRNAVKIVQNINTGNFHIEDEELFYTFLQLMCIGLLGLYTSIETMVYELYVRKNNVSPITVDGRELNFNEFTNLGFERKITGIASQLSSRDNIRGTSVHAGAMKIHELRNLIQHWNIARGDDYFINIPTNHPLRIFPESNPIELVEYTRNTLDHYKLG